MDVIKEYVERLGQREGAAKMQKDLIEGTTLRAITHDNLIPSTAVSRFHKEHRYTGYAAIIDDRPVLYCAQHGGKFKPTPAELRFNPWYWDELGGAFTFSLIYQKQYIAPTTFLTTITRTYGYQRRHTPHPRSDAEACPG